MPRKRLTQLFPSLIPLRTKQRKFCYYLKMRFDKNNYAEKKGAQLPFTVFTCKSNMYNKNTGFDMVYQHNKVHNLRLGADALEKLLIRPGEVFSYSRAVRYADKKIPYKDGLALRDGRLVTDYGGGMCQLSDLLFTLFLHSPLTIVERHGHKIKDFPDPDPAAPKGTDATVFEGWLDLKVKNNTEHTFQLTFDFEGEYIIGTLLSNMRDRMTYKVFNGRVEYLREEDGLYETAEVFRGSYVGSDCAAKEHLYDNRCRIGYEINEGEDIK